MSSPRAKRTQLSKKTRFEVFKRDGFKCMYCGAHPPAAVLHVDHIHPVAEGGDNDINNLVTACEPCNLGKGARSLASVPKSLADKAAEIQEAEEQLQGFQDVLRAARERLESQTWVIVEMLFGPVESVKRDDFNSIKRFIESLGMEQVIEAADVALSSGVYPVSRRFRYFCGVCWNKVREAKK